MKKILSYFLISVLCFPILHGITHYVLEDHSFCYERGLHFHEKEIECSTCDFLRLSFDYDSNELEFSYDQFYFFNENVIFQKEIYFSRFINGLILEAHQLIVNFYYQFNQTLIKFYHEKHF